jgi:hypothetical protein
MGCQESISEYKEHNDCLDFFRNLCGKNPEKEIQYTKYFGCGTFITVLSIFILVASFIHPKTEAKAGKL